MGNLKARTHNGPKEPEMCLLDSGRILAALRKVMGTIPNEILRKVLMEIPMRVMRTISMMGQISQKEKVHLKSPKW